MDNFNKYKDLTIVIVTFYSENIIYKCIESIGKNIKIIIVENSNNLELKKDIEKKYPNVQVLLAENNLGYGKANNLGIKHSETNFVLILNPDTLIDPSNIEILLEYAKNYQPTILAPIIKGKEYGKLFVYIQGKPTIEIPLIAANNIKQVNPLFRIFSAIKYLIFGTSLDEKS